MWAIERDLAPECNRSRFIVLTMKLSQEDGLWVGECVELGTSGSAATFEETMEVMRDLIALHLGALWDVGERERFLGEHGIQVWERRPGADEATERIAVTSGAFTTRIVQPLRDYNGPGAASA